MAYLVTQLGVMCSVVACKHVIITWYVQSHCLAMGMFSELFYSNSCLCWLSACMPQYCSSSWCRWGARELYESCRLPGIKLPFVGVLSWNSGLGCCTLYLIRDGIRHEPLATRWSKLWQLEEINSPPPPCSLASDAIPLRMLSSLRYCKIIPVLSSSCCLIMAT